MGNTLREVGLVLACDLTREGRLGPHTLSRLKRGLLWHKETGCTLIVAAGRSPYHPEVSQTMAELMGEWILAKQLRRPNLVIKEAKTFDTRGELNALKEVEAFQYTIITAWWHLPRAKLIAWQVFPSEVLVRGVADWNDNPTLRQLVLEVPKYIHTMLPAKWRIKARGLWEKLFGRSSW